MSKLSLILLAVAVVAVVLAPSALAQDVPGCVEALHPCDPFINSTTAKPPVACCKPLKNALDNELPCLCSISESREMILSLSLNVTEALTLPERCGFKFDLIAQCTALAKAPTQAPASVHQKPPHKHAYSPAAAAAASPPPGAKPSDAASKIASIGSVFGAFLLLATLMFN